MNKNGFTLIELLSVITILGLIGVVASVNIVNIMDNKRQEEVELEEAIVTEAACVYIELKKNETLKNDCLANGCDITTDTLISEGIIKDNDVDNAYVIHIELKDNEKHCTIK